MTGSWTWKPFSMPPRRFFWRRLIVAGIALACSIAWLEARERNGWKNPMNGDRNCGREAEVVGAWSYTGAERRPEHLEALDRWAHDNPEAVNRPRGAFCRTPLHVAAEFGREDLAAILLARGASVAALDEDGDTPLHTAAAYGSVAVALLLIEHGAEVNAMGGYWGSPLHAAARGVVAADGLAGRLQIATMLLERGAAVNVRDRSGGTPLHYALRRSSGNADATPAMAELLVAHGAVVETANP